jgi:hypothetical protein
MKEFNKKLTEDMYQKWNDGTTIAQLEKENNLSKESIYKRFGRLRKYQENNNAAIDVETYSQDYTDENASDIVIEETIADSDVNENVHTAENYRDDDVDYKVSTIPFKQDTEEYKTATEEEENTRIVKTGFVDGRIAAGVIIVIFLGIVIGLYGPQIWSTLKGIKSKMREKIINMHEKHLVSEYDYNSYYEEPI